MRELRVNLALRYRVSPVKVKRMPTILLVDDDTRFGTALARLLQREGYGVHRACNSAEALELARRREDAVDMVIADMHLCHERGLDLLGELHQTRSDLPIILLSASPDIQAFLAALRVGAYEYLPKLVNFAELRQVVRRALSAGRGDQT